MKAIHTPTRGTGFQPVLRALGVVSLTTSQSGRRPHGQDARATMALILPVMALLIVAVVCRAEVTTAPNVTVNHTNLEPAAATAIAKTLSAARAVYVEQFGLDMPNKVLATVTIGPDQPTRLYTDGNDRVYLSLPDASKLAKPQTSGVFNLYGMCHELGHMAMYRTLKDRDWLSTAGAEGFAHYAGSVVVDAVYEKEGEKLWRDPYDYRPDGTARLKQQLAAAKPSDIVRAAGEWQALAGILEGPKALRGVFEAWQAAKIDPARAETALLAELTKIRRERTDHLTKWWKSAAPLLVEKTGASSFAKQTVAPNKLAGQPTILKNDDDAADGKKSTAGGGHLRRFTAPDDGKQDPNADKGTPTDFYLTAVHIHAGRYGPAQAPPTQFDVTLCDEQNRIIATYKFPYATVPRGGSQWVRLQLPTPTRLPKDFMVALNFRPTASSGVFMSLDNSTTGSSQSGLPGKKAAPLKDADWMIRAEVDRAR